MPGSTNQTDAALGGFLRRVWKEDVGPLLRDKRAEQRRKSARVGGKIAATGGLLIDSLFHLRGRPFTRAMTVMGASLGAMAPDVWDWKWLRSSATDQQRQVVNERIKRRAAELPEADALALFNLTPADGRTRLKQAWREISQRWHPDKAPNEEARFEYHLRFVAYQAAYERLCRAYDEQRLPRSPGGDASSD